MLKFFLLAIIIFISTLVIFFSESGYYKGIISDHFDGKSFYNPKEKNIDQKRSFFSYFFNKFKYEKQFGKVKWQDKLISIEQNKPLQKINDKSIHLTYVGHSTFLLQLEGLNILTDPIFSNRASPFTFLGPKRAIITGINFNDLPKIDIVLISHSHYDHMDLPTIVKLQKHSQPKFITGLGNCFFLNKIRKMNLDCVELDWHEKFSSSQNFNIHFLPALHWSKRMMLGRNASLWGAFAIESKIGNIYFAGDTGYDLHFSDAKKQFKQFKLALLPIGAYKPQDFMLKYHLSPSQAVKAHFDLNSKKSIAMHYQTFKLSSENFDDPVIDLENEKKLKKISADFITLKVGKKLILN